MIQKRQIGIFLLIAFVGFCTTYIQAKGERDFINPLGGKTNVLHRLRIFFWQQKITPCLRIQGDSQKFDCINDLLRVLSQRYGARIALDVIEPLTEPNQFIMANSHNLSHTIGDFAVFVGRDRDAGVDSEERIIQNLGRALVECDGWGSFGCYHGVVEAGLARIDPSDRARVVRKACLENPLVTSEQYYINQCMHWFGHGMAIFTDQSLLTTLDMCESASSDFDSDEVQLCLSGVFHAGTLPGISDDTLLANIARVYNPADAYYPCHDVQERFKGHCFSHVPGRSNSADVGVMLTNCNHIPEPDVNKRTRYIKLCYDSVGNGLLDSTKNDPEAIVRLCQQYAIPELLGYCFTGPARYATLRNPLLTNTISFAICKAAPLSAKNVCYAAIGFGNFENYKSEDVLSRYCDKVESGYKEDCMSKKYE